MLCSHKVVQLAIIDAIADIQLHCASQRRIERRHLECANSTRAIHEHLATRRSRVLDALRHVQHAQTGLEAAGGVRAVATAQRVTHLEDVTIGIGKHLEVALLGGPLGLALVLHAYNVVQLRRRQDATVHNIGAHTECALAHKGRQFLKQQSES